MRRLSLILAAGISCYAAATPAQTKPDAAIRYRQAMMLLIGWNFDVLGAMSRGRTPFDAKEFSMHAERLAAFGPQIIEGFPQGSETGKVLSDASAALWKDYAGFQASVNEYGVESKKLAEIAKAGDEAATKEQFRKVADTCKNCHEKYKGD